MDWSTNDCTRTYADTFYVPEPDHDEGIQLLDEAGLASDPHGDWVRAPYRHYPERGGRFGWPARPPLEGPAAGTPYNARLAARYPPSEPLREGYYTGGNIVSAPRSHARAAHHVAWDERPLHYSPHAGTDWAHLAPLPEQRPPGGGPAPHLAFPLITTSEAQVRGKDLFAGGAPCACGGRGDATQLIKLVLLVVIAVLLAMSLAEGRSERGLEKAVQSAVASLAQGFQPAGRAPPLAG